MKVTHSQRGSSHLVIIIILVVALLGALGFIFWQNFVGQSDTEVENTQSSSQNSDISQLEPTYVVLSNLGIRVPYFSSEDTYTAGEPNEAGAVTIYSKVVADAGCTYEAPELPGAIGGVIATPVSEDQSDSLSRKVVKDDIVYIFSPVQNPCEAADAQQAAYERFAEQFDKLEVL